MQTTKMTILQNQNINKNISWYKDQGVINYLHITRCTVQFSFKKITFLRKNTIRPLSKKKPDSMYYRINYTIKTFSLYKTKCL